jgi:hypothetical protein
VLSYHSQVLARPGLVSSLASVARALSSDSATWVAPVGEVAEWWRVRAQLRVRSSVAGSRMLVVVRNPSDSAAKGVVVRVALPESKRAVHADSGLLPSVDRTARVVIPDIPPRSVRSATVVLADPP